MRVNVYGSDGKPFDDEHEIVTFEELVDFVNNRYQLDSDMDAEGMDSFSAVIQTGNAHDVIFAAYVLNDGSVVCGCLDLKSYITKPDEQWAKDIIEHYGLTKADLKRDHGYPISEVVCDDVAKAFEDEDNYSDDFIKTLRIPCMVRDIDDLVFQAEQTLDYLYDKITDKLEKVARKILREKTEARRKTFENDDEIQTQPKTDKRSLDRMIKRIFDDPEVKRLTSRVLTDDGAWGPFQSLVKALNNIDGVVHVSYGDSTKRSGLSNGYRWASFDGGNTNVMKDKIRDVIIDTDFGTLEGEIACWGAGTIKDPLERYDMTLQLWKA